MKNKILEIFKKHQKMAKLGSDGDYETFMCLDEDDFNEIASEIVGQIEPLVMQWRTRDEKPLAFKRIIIFSPCYPEESDMRKRIITGQFLALCTEATHWSYISEPSA